jgi:hypothetical protein
MTSAPKAAAFDKHIPSQNVVVLLTGSVRNETDLVVSTLRKASAFVALTVDN